MGVNQQVEKLLAFSVRICNFGKDPEKQKPLRVNCCDLKNDLAMKKKPFNTEGIDISKTCELKQQVGPALKKESLHDQKCITQNTGAQD